MKPEDSATHPRRPRKARIADFTRDSEGGPLLLARNGKVGRVQGMYLGAFYPPSSLAKMRVARAHVGKHQGQRIEQAKPKDILGGGWALREF